MATLQTFGVDTTYIGNQLPQLQIDADAVPTATIAQLVKAAASVIHGALVRAYDASTPDDIAAAGASDPSYVACQALIWRQMRPTIMEAAHMPESLENLDQYREDAVQDLNRMRLDPLGAFGWVASAPSPNVATSTDELGLATDETSLRDRRQFDDRSSTYGVDTGGFRW